MCCYHGWHFDYDGTLIAAGAEPAANLEPLQLLQGAYPVRAASGNDFRVYGTAGADAGIPRSSTRSRIRPITG